MHVMLTRACVYVCVCLLVCVRVFVWVGWGGCMGRWMGCGFKTVLCYHVTDFDHGGGLYS